MYGRYNIMRKGRCFNKRFKTEIYKKNINTSCWEKNNSFE